MNLELIRTQLRELEELTQDWSVEVSDIEREIALDKLKRLYEEVRFGKTPHTEVVAPEVIAKEEELLAATEEESTEEEVDIISIDLEDISIIEDEEVAEEVENAPAQTTEPQVAEPTPQVESPSASSLFDLNTIPIRTQSRRSAILSLYSEGVTTPPAPTPPTEPKEGIIVENLTFEEEEQSVIESVSTPEVAPQIIGDTAPTITIADMYATEQPAIIDSTAPQGSINDQYIIAQELFGGDMESCEAMLAELESIESFDDSMIYLVENFDLDPDSAAAKLIVKLLESKYENQ